ncbi:MAG: hypothetical protein SRB2_02826 [Desulfobacteraceae bacterium Eth-SRB2]|nr:MAG: hypothetical protein SRB2_02826 [Desulfobacteraceae bacterium Eth-SRB2]
MDGFNKRGEGETSLSHMACQSEGNHLKIIEKQKLGQNVAGGDTVTHLSRIFHENFRGLFFITNEKHLFLRILFIVVR